MDRVGFERAMEEQRARARAASKFIKMGADAEAAEWTGAIAGEDSEFLGYATLDYHGATLRRWRPRGEELELVLDRTPAYPEGGGQVADQGLVLAPGVRAALTHVYREGESTVHRVLLAEGTREALLAAGAAGGLRVEVAPEQRLPTQRHHTATHLLHAALRAVLGEHVRQAGSLVAPDRLRFDYQHFEAPSAGQLARIEERVNEWVLADREVSAQVMPIAQAKALGAMMLFGEKYGAEVRLVTTVGVPEHGIEPSRELCGGTHVSRTGEIGAFWLVSDSAIASGVRRIEALCGHEALRYAHEQTETLQRVAGLLQTSPGGTGRAGRKAQGRGGVSQERTRAPRREGCRRGVGRVHRLGRCREERPLVCNRDQVPGQRRDAKRCCGPHAQGPWSGCCCGCLQERWQTHIYGIR